MPLTELDIPYFAAESAVILHDKDYFYYLLDAFRTARRRIQVMQFLMDVRPIADPQREVRTLCHALGEAAWRGVDVRVLLSPFLVSWPTPTDVNGVAARFLYARGAVVRSYRPEEGSSRDTMHSKLVVVDDRLVVLGSHNWTCGAFNNNTETSVAVQAPDLARYFRGTFRRLWLQSPKWEPADQGISR